MEIMSESDSDRLSVNRFFRAETYDNAWNPTSANQRDKLSNTKGLFSRGEAFIQHRGAWRQRALATPALGNWVGPATRQQMCKSAPLPHQLRELQRQSII